MRTTPIIETYMNWLDTRSPNKAPRRLDFSLRQFRPNIKNLFALRREDRLNFGISVSSEKLNDIFRKETISERIDSLFVNQKNSMIGHLLECAHRDSIPVWLDLLTSYKDETESHFEMLVLPYGEAAMLDARLICLLQINSISARTEKETPDGFRLNGFKFLPPSRIHSMGPFLAVHDGYEIRMAA